MKKKLRVLQLASFEGNIGDNANHSGTRKLLRQNLVNFELEFFDLEIREFFWKKKKYDNSFADLVNKYDLFLFGGGNFFELWVDNSCNNTSVDIPIDILKRINTPTIFYSLGMDPGMGVSEKGIEKFKTWLDYVIMEDRFLLSLRNDGALETAHLLLGESYAENFHPVPDGGFFTEVIDQFHPEIPDGKIVIGINLAGDMLDIRFPNSEQNDISYEEFLADLADLLNNLLNENEKIHLIFFPHIFKDLRIISDLLYKLKDWHVRKRVTVAPYLHGQGAQEYNFDGYRKCNLIMGNRFHTNVCAIGLNVPTIGFENYRQIRKLYEELDLQDRTIRVNIKGFKKLLEEKIITTLAREEKVKNSYALKKQELTTQINKFHSYINSWLIQLYPSKRD